MEGLDGSITFSKEQWKEQKTSKWNHIKTNEPWKGERGKQQLILCFWLKTDVRKSGLDVRLMGKKNVIEFNWFLSQTLLQMWMNISSLY